MATSFQCFNCEHYTGGSKTGSHCKAYPEDKGKPIPEEIIRGKHNHAKKFDGDNGIRYKPVTKILDFTGED
tara:strand:+ start:384 stop:596 length:213 start_codon:yes stop_codon:yes gene_type:complete